jgi:hypothetical protein
VKTRHILTAAALASGALVLPAHAAVAPTQRQAVKDTRGDCQLSGFDILHASATRDGSHVIFKIKNAHRLNKHDGSGNPVAPSIRIDHPGNPIDIFPSGDVFGFGPGSRHAKVTVKGRRITYDVKLKTIGDPDSFDWRAIMLDADHVRDAAPNKGRLTFVVR